MEKEQVLFTKTALKNLRNIGLYTQRKWGKKQAHRYIRSLISECHLMAPQQKLKPHIKPLALPELFLHKTNHHYIIFKRPEEHSVTILNFFHERMDIPTRLKEMQHLSENDIKLAGKESILTKLFDFV